jgi:hypothetical protein
MMSHHGEFPRSRKSLNPPIAINGHQTSQTGIRTDVQRPHTPTGRKPLTLSIIFGGAEILARTGARRSFNSDDDDDGERRASISFYCTFVCTEYSVR